jgi:hypothetical protein
MWMPRDAAAVEAAARGGELAETSRFEVKEALPASKKNVDVAIDVSAMTVAGGQLLYGLAEDEHGEPTVPKPIELKGAAERIGNVVSTSVAEVPAYSSQAFPLTDDPSRGFLLLSIPTSSRAPHMVIVKGEGRYYGRSDKANRILLEDEVARLYDRRAKWDVDREALLRRTIDATPFAPERDHGYLHAFIQPVPPDTELWSRATIAGSTSLCSNSPRGTGRRLARARRSEYSRN